MDDGASRADRVDVVGRQAQTPSDHGDGIGSPLNGAVELRHHAASADRQTLSASESRYR